MKSNINLVYLGLWMLVISLGMFQFGYGIAYFSSFFGVIHSQLEEKGNPVIK